MEEVGWYIHILVVPLEVGNLGLHTWSLATTHFIWSAYMEGGGGWGRKDTPHTVH